PGRLNAPGPRPRAACGRMTDARTAVITGCGAISALGPDWASFANAVRSRRGASPGPAPGVSGDDPPLCYTIPAGLLPDGKRDEPTSTLAIAAATQAVAAAGISVGD